MKKTLTNVAASVHARLLTRAQTHQEDFNLTVQRYLAERFLYRVGASPHRERLILKGAMLLPLWGGDLYRATRDVDLTGYVENDAGILVTIIREICAIPCLEDGVVFLPDTVRAEPIRDSSDYQGFRVKLAARMEKARLRLQVDVGFGDAVEPTAIEDYPTLLDIPRPRIRVYPREAVVAEKLHAMVLLGEANTRFKDFYDVYTLARRFEFDGCTLAKAVSATFTRRRTAPPEGRPAALTAGFYSQEARQAEWGRYLVRSGLQDAPRDFSTVGTLLMAFLEPALDAFGGSRASEGIWPPGGAWARSKAPGE